MQDIHQVAEDGKTGAVTGYRTRSFGPSRHRSPAGVSAHPVDSCPGWTKGGSRLHWGAFTLEGAVPAVFLRGGLTRGEHGLVSALSNPPEVTGSRSAWSCPSWGDTGCTVQPPGRGPGCTTGRRCQREENASLDVSRYTVDVEARKIRGVFGNASGLTFRPQSRSLFLVINSPTGWSKSTCREHQTEHPAGRFRGHRGSGLPGPGPVRHSRRASPSPVCGPRRKDRPLDQVQ
ncbi:MAG: hypothetical protein Ct9H300mP1_07630 [Planctomycetaceae bacterium]|nr:MAG: hypothetical protein Ct9H300mP1_07630 [Planctomycetaceae bacterium]